MKKKRDHKVKNYRKHMGKILVSDDFVLFRPKVGYRVNSNSVLVKNSENAGFIFECAPNSALSIDLIKRYMKEQEIDFNYIKFIIISHAHQDHYANLKKYQISFPKAKTITHANDLSSLRYPFLLPKTWKSGLRYKGFNKNSIRIYSSIYILLNHFYFNSLQRANQIDFSFKEDLNLSKFWEAFPNLNDQVKEKDLDITLLHTPGHSPGHTCVIDAHKNLFVADLVPFTPWCCPVVEGINQMISSIKKILSFSNKEIKRIVKSHGDIRRSPHFRWEIVPYEIEKPKYQFFLDSIYRTLEKIPQKIKGKEADLEYICALFNPNFAKYSKLMKAVFIPPAISWAIAYALKLEKEGKIRRIIKKNQIYWTS